MFLQQTDTTSTQLSIARRTPFAMKFSFGEIIENLENQPPESRSQKDSALLAELAQYPEFRDGITDLMLLTEKEDLLRRLLQGYFAPGLTRNEIKAVGMPFMPMIFNLTERFRKLLSDAGHDFELNIRDFDEHQAYVLSCCMILNKVYGTMWDFNKPLFYDITTAEGIVMHYRILYNADHLHIYPTEKSLPLTQDDIDDLLNNYDDLSLWKSKIPEESWIIKGFSLITLYDATVENAVSIFKEKLLSLSSFNFLPSVTSILRSIFRIPDLRLGFTLFNAEDNRFRKTALAQRMPSFILEHIPDAEDSQLRCLNSYQNLVHDRSYFAISDADKYLEDHPDSQLVRNLRAQEIKSFILAPIIKNNVLLGVLEVVSRRPKELHSLKANRLDVIIPFLADKIERLVVELEHEIQAFIQDKFTSLHSSVNWKFRNEAKKYLAGLQQGKEEPLGEIVFDNVFPLYGQVDVKGSSEARNVSVQKDLELQLHAMNSVLHDLEKQLGKDLFKKERQQIGLFLEQLPGMWHVNSERNIVSYLDGVHERLSKIKHPEVLPVLNDYFTENDKDRGDFYSYRRRYERTVTTINEKLTGVLDAQQAEAQKIFPHYYERFKTDGVEHNLYIGSSIAPNKTFDLPKLDELRFWQLRVLCEMEAAHHALLPTLPFPLTVTTLIFVYHSTIAIRFRMDEKRFDVDGSYNARFEIVKKRIDKATIKNSGERIAATGKITVVYSNPEDQQDYLRYVRRLQAEGILDQDVEQFDIEDLQSVSGLKGLRVSIIH